MPELSESEAKEMKEKLTAIKQEVSSDNTQPENQRPHQNFTIGSVALPSTLTKYENDSYILREKTQQCARVITLKALRLHASWKTVHAVSGQS
jgi:hypothetical protein